MVCNVVWKPEGLVACPLEFPLPGSWPYPLHDTVKESSCAMGSGYLKNMFCVRYFSSMNPVVG